MRLPKVYRLPLLALLVAVALSGCRRGGDAPKANLGGSGLAEIGEVYKFLAYEKKPAPSKLEDLRQYIDSLPTSWEKLEKGEYVVLWGVGLAPGSQAVLAYEKDAPAQGGNVLLRDGTVKQMTAQEFQAAPKAR
jgi:hypothetical protein